MTKDTKTIRVAFGGRSEALAAQSIATMLGANAYVEQHPFRLTHVAGDFPPDHDPIRHGYSHPHRHPEATRSDGDRVEPENLFVLTVHFPEPVRSDNPAVVELRRYGKDLEMREAEAKDRARMLDRVLDEARSFTGMKRLLKQMARDERQKASQLSDFQDDVNNQLDGGSD